LSIGKDRSRKDGYQQKDKKQETASRNVINDLRTKIVHGKERHTSNLIMVIIINYVVKNDSIQLVIVAEKSLVLLGYITDFTQYIISSRRNW
jgi:hypothetical protein